MKVIFLDVDGVLNSYSTKEKIAGYTFVSDPKVRLLKEIIERTNAKVVLSSTWRYGWCMDHPEFATDSDNADIILFKAFKDKLNSFGIELISYTSDFDNRGEEIDYWLKHWKGEPIESFIILDDMCGNKLRPHSQYLIQTSLSEGLNKNHVERAVKMLNGITNKKVCEFS